MKRKSIIFVLLLSLVLFLGACSNSNDEMTSLKDAIDGLENEVIALQFQVEELESQKDKNDSVVKGLRERFFLAEKSVEAYKKLKIHK